MSETSRPLKVGVIGLGIMGLCYARHAAAGGYAVSGCDVAAERVAALEAAGGEARAGAAEVAADSDVLLVALASVPALQAVTAEISRTIRPGAVVVEMGTLPLEAKEALRDAMQAKGAATLDAPVSGTGAQAENRDLSIYVSGDAAAAETARPVFEALARDVRHVGPFGDGMKLKYVANLLVTVHNLAAAEALLLAKRTGLDLQMAFDALKSGAGTSRMFEVRGPMMIADAYEPATMKMDVYMKDIALILDFARNSRTPVPLMTASLPYYVAALAQGRDKQDTAALFAVLEAATLKAPA
jgi:putative dehydrogenase